MPLLPSPFSRRTMPATSMAISFGKRGGECASSPCWRHRADDWRPALKRPAAGGTLKYISVYWSAGAQRGSSMAAADAAHRGRASAPLYNPPHIAASLDSVVDAAEYRVDARGLVADPDRQTIYACSLVAPARLAHNRGPTAPRAP